MDSPAAGFTRLAVLTLKREGGEQAATFAPVEARFVKIRITSQYLGDDLQVGLGKIKVFGVLEGSGRDRVEALAAAAQAPPPPPPGVIPGDACEASPAAPAPPTHGASAKVLVLSRKDTAYPPLRYSAKDVADTAASPLFERLAFTRIPPGRGQRRAARIRRRGSTRSSSRRFATSRPAFPIVSSVH